MKISKTSWHYRLNKFNNNKFVDRVDGGWYSTCSYIRTTFASLFSLLFKCFAIAFCFGAIGGLLMIVIVVPIRIFMGVNPPQDLGIVCLIFWSGIAFALLAWFLKSTFERLSNCGTSKKEPNVFVQAIIDKHNKICTLVTADD